MNTDNTKSRGILPIFYNSQFGIWSSIIFSITVCAIVTWIHIHQQSRVEQVLNKLENIRQARIDLTKGFLHFSLSGTPGSPFGHPEGLALLQQAISSFDQAIKELDEVDLNKVDSFRQSVNDFSEHLEKWKNEGNTSSQAIELRILFNNLEQQANSIDILTQRHLLQLSSRFDFQFAAALIIAILFLSAICGVVLHIGKVKNRFESSSKERQEQIEAIFKFASAGIIQILPGNREIIKCNEKFCEITGFSEQELLRMKLGDLSHPNDKQDDLDLFLNAAQNETANYRNIMRYIRKNSSTIWVRLNASFIRDSEGIPVSAVAICEDITDQKNTEEEHKRLQAQLLHAQKMESIGRLAGGVAHDFNNILGIILGHAEIVMDQMNPSQPLFLDLEEIKAAAERASNLTRQLLAFARKQAVTPQVLDLNECVEKMLKMIRRLIGENIEFSWSPGNKLWYVFMDTTQIDQIIANLCVNARDAINSAGKLSIETGNEEFSEGYCKEHFGYNQGEFVRLSISDNGTGMSQEIVDQIFEPFFTTKEAGSGTGLGLATVYGIVKQNNGFIIVKSILNSGTVFNIYLPRYIGEKTEVLMDFTSNTLSGRGITILLAEDEKEFLNIAKSMLEMEGYTVLAANSPNEAIRLSEDYSGKIHLLLTDVVMPEMSGKNLSTAITRKRSDLKTLYMSGYPLDMIVSQENLDGSAFIQKPFSRLVLTAKIKETLAQQ